MLIPLSELLLAADSERPLAWHQGRYRRVSEFKAAVAAWAAQFRQQPDPAYALYCDAAYPFAVLLFALLHAGKTVWVAANNRPGTADFLLQRGGRLIGDWPALAPVDYSLPPLGEQAFAVDALNPDQSQLLIFTSGSTGDVKPVAKCLAQLQAEIDNLERRWGESLATAEALATVSHQHIYGLLFRVLWPLSAGRCFHSHMAISPEILLTQAESAYWVASPAHLKRLDADSPWPGLSKLAAIFSSGGPLAPLAAQRIIENTGRAAVEVYGSTETGGIAWRQSPDQAWSLFEGLRLLAAGDGILLHSPYLPSGEALLLDDRLNLQADGRFLLAGRRDRIVKVEEKRLSLDELEQRLLEMPWVGEAAALAIAGSRDIVAAVVVLTAEGRSFLQHHGRNALIKALRQALHRWFEAVVLPRKWLFVSDLPLNAQGKVDSALLKRLLASDNRRYPSVQALRLAADGAELHIKAGSDLCYFPDHFPGLPLLPGVVQIAWGDYFGKLLFPITASFRRLEAIRFFQAIAPGCELTLNLRWQAADGKLSFSLVSADRVYSRGRLVYGREQQ